ncbi:MAG: glutamine--tRNA ligase/YqeY domain fusion protein [Clostridiaceae bacterium]|nr:glutamine--tRNA ligase/YqeY domain fusion protein [Clostridiaceae bacterium]
MTEYKKSVLKNPGNMPNNFIHDFIDQDLAKGGQYEGRTVHTRFPPEPNGYLHIGHAKAIYIDFATAEKYQGLCNLRMDDTNPIREDVEYIDAIKEDVHWLGYDWGDRFYYASDYFEEMYGYAIELIEKGLAYVCELTAEQIRETRGTLTEPGQNSPYRDRPIEENLDLFSRMRAGEFEDGRMTLRAKIDMNSGNINMRDPVIYRIAHETHHRTGDTWCIYPMYDFAHPLEDAIEGITHSLCSLEFEDHRPLYDWFIENCSVPYIPRQIEFARLNIEYTVMSKRKLRSLVEEGIVDGWDDPRMPTISGLRRRGYTPQAIRNFCERIGISKVDSVVSHDFLEFCLREDLNDHALRGSAVLDPVKLIITNYPEDQTEQVIVQNFPYKPELGSHEMSFSREVWIERNDYAVDPPKKYHRLFKGNEVRLRSAYIVKCTGHLEDENGNITAVLAEYDPESQGGKAADGRKVRGTIHWVDVNAAIDSEVRIYENLFTVKEPDVSAADYHELINPDSLQIIEHAKLEPWLLQPEFRESAFQFIRQGYFIQDNKDSTTEKLVFNRSVSLRESYKPE